MRKEIKHALPAYRSFEDFSKNVTVVKPHRYASIEDFSESEVEKIKYMHIYGACIYDDGTLDGCYIVEYKNGLFSCHVTKEEVLTPDLEKAEQFLYNDWYRHECV